MKKYRKYTPAAIEFIKQNYETMRCKEFQSLIKQVLEKETFRIT